MSGETIAGEKSKQDEKKGAVPTKYVKLNVGGTLFYTTLGTLTKRADSMLRAMFSGRMEVLTDTEGTVLFKDKLTLILHFKDILHVHVYVVRSQRNG